MKETGKKVRVRIAPSPTGIPHIGNTRTALFNYLFAKKYNGDFIVRIEDTDQSRLVAGAQDAIFEILDWLGLKYDEKYIQSERLEEYKKHVKILLDKNFAYEKDGAIWVKMPEGKEFSWTDAIGDKKITFKSDIEKDFVALKSDGFPTYHLANVVDDYLMKITHVIRGDEWISSTPKHLYLYECFGWEAPVFAHLPVILGPDKSKLSKRHGAESVLDYRAKGYLKEALLNYMVLLGWNPGGDREKMKLSEMEQLFDLRDVNTGSPIFDFKKLEWMNGEYIRQLSDEELMQRVIEFDFLIEKEIPKDMFLRFINIAKTRIKTLQEFKELVLPFLNPPKLNLNNEEADFKNKLKEGLENIKNWNKDELTNFFSEVFVREGKRFPYLYKVVIGLEKGLPIADAFEILGKEKTLNLIR